MDDIIKRNINEILKWRLDKNIKVKIIETLKIIFTKILNLNHNKFYNRNDINRIMNLIDADLVKLLILIGNNNKLNVDIGLLLVKTIDEMVEYGEMFDEYELCSNMLKIKEELIVALV